MTIECYYGSCKYHSSQHYAVDNGPFCYEQECLASQYELEMFNKLRKLYLENVSKNSERPTSASNAE